MHGYTPLTMLRGKGRDLKRLGGADDRVLREADKELVQRQAPMLDEFLLKAVEHRAEPALVGQSGDEVAGVLLGERGVEPHEVVEAPRHGRVG